MFSRRANTDDPLFAKRVSDISDSRIEAGVVVEPGTTAFVIVDGAIVGSITAGRYSFDDIKAAHADKDSSPGVIQKLWTSLKGIVSRRKLGVKVDTMSVVVLLVDSADTELTFNAAEDDRLFTSDGVKVTVKAKVCVTLRSALEFYTNVLKGDGEYRVSKLQEQVKPLLMNALRMAVVGYSLADLMPPGTGVPGLQGKVLRGANDLLGRQGLTISYWREFDILQTGMERAANTKSDRTVWDAEAGATLDLKRTVADRMLEEQAIDHSLDLSEKKLGDSAALARRKQERNQEVEKLRVDVEGREGYQALLEKLLEGDRLEQIAHLRSREELDEFTAGVMKSQMLRESDVKLLMGVIEDKERNQADLLAHTRAVLIETRAHEMLELKAQRARLDQVIERLRREEQVEAIKTETQLAEERARAAEHAARGGMAGAREAFKLDKEKDDSDFDRFRQMQEAKKERLRLEHELQMEKDRLAKQQELELQRLQVDVSKTEIEKDRAIGVTQAQTDSKHRDELEKLLKERGSELRTDRDKDLDRMERMFGAVTGMQGEAAKERERLAGERAEKVEQMSERSMDRMAEVSGAAAGAPRTRVCGSCGEQTPLGKKFCQSCGKPLG